MATFTEAELFSPAGRAWYTTTSGGSVQFTGVVKSLDADEGVGTIVREPDRHVIVVHPLASRSGSRR